MGSEMTVHHDRRESTSVGETGDSLQKRGGSEVEIRWEEDRTRRHTFIVIRSDLLRHRLHERLSFDRLLSHVNGVVR